MNLDPAATPRHVDAADAARRPAHGRSAGPRDERSRILGDVVARGPIPCPVCREDLAVDAEDRCRNCRVHLRVGLDRRGMGSAAWATGVLAASVGSGFYLLTIPSLIGQVRSGNLPDGTAIWAAGLVVSTGLLAAWLGGRRRIRRWTRRRIRAAAAATLGISLLLVLALAVVE